MPVELSSAQSFYYYNLALKNTSNTCDSKIIKQTKDYLNLTIKHANDSKEKISQLLPNELDYLRINQFEQMVGYKSAATTKINEINSRC